MGSGEKNGILWRMLHFTICSSIFSLKGLKFIVFTLKELAALITYQNRKAAYWALCLQPPTRTQFFVFLATMIKERWHAWKGIKFEVQVQVQQGTTDQVVKCPTAVCGSLKPRFRPLEPTWAKHQSAVSVDQQVNTSADEPFGTRAEQLLLNFQYATWLVRNSCSPLESLNYAPRRGTTPAVQTVVLHFIRSTEVKEDVRHLFPTPTSKLGEGKEVRLSGFPLVKPKPGASVRSEIWEIQGDDTQITCDVNVVTLLAQRSLLVYQPTHLNVNIRFSYYFLLF